MTDEPIPAMSKEELHAFVQGVCDGRIFTMGQCRTPDEIRMVFMPIGLGCLADMSEPRVQSIGMIWEWFDQAGPRSINGLPSFFSVRFMNKEDWAEVFPKILAEQERRKVIV